MKIEIRKEFGHYAVYVDGERYCTADTKGEAYKEKWKIIEKNRDK